MFGFGFCFQLSLGQIDQCPCQLAQVRRVASERASALRPVDLLLAGYLVVVSVVAVSRPPPPSFRFQVPRQPRRYP